MRRVLRQREIVVDHWRDVDEAPGDGSEPVIVPFARWQSERDAWRRRRGPLGVRIGPTDSPERLADDLERLELIAIEFAGIGEGRGYSQARMLRGRLGFGGELRAVGAVSQDQVVFLARSGFDAFMLPDDQLEDAVSALDRYSVAYQRADERLVRPLMRSDRLEA